MYFYTYKPREHVKVRPSLWKLKIMIICSVCNSRKHAGTVDVRSSNMEQVWTRTIFTLVPEFIFGLLCNNGTERLVDFVIC